jgi:hypothetical protein
MADRPPKAMLSEREGGEGGERQAQRWALTGWRRVAGTPEAETSSGLIAAATESSSPLSRSLSIAVRPSVGAGT